jgi:hypothetical protein
MSCWRFFGGSECGTVCIVSTLLYLSCWLYSWFSWLLLNRCISDLAVFISSSAILWYSSCLLNAADSMWIRNSSQEISLNKNQKRPVSQRYREQINMVKSDLWFWARGHGANRFSKAVGSDGWGGSEETCMHIHGGTGCTSATRLNSVPIMATMYKIPQQQCPFHERIKSSPGNHWRYCSVLPGESFRCRSGHGPNLAMDRSRAQTQSAIHHSCARRRCVYIL